MFYPTLSIYTFDVVVVVMGTLSSHTQRTQVSFHEVLGQPYRSDQCYRLRIQGAPEICQQPQDLSQGLMQKTIYRNHLLIHCFPDLKTEAFKDSCGAYI